MLPERPLGIFHCAAIRHDAQLARVVQLHAPKRFVNRKAQAGSFESVGDAHLRLREHEADLAIGQIETDRHFGIALVGALPDAEPAADALPTIDQMDVAALVEEGVVLNDVIEVVRRLKRAHGSMLARIVHG